MSIFQFTGLSGAGKTTLTNLLVEILCSNGLQVEIIDGDHYRATLCADLGSTELAGKKISERWELLQIHLANRAKLR